jgi:maltose phosphorylase
LDKAIENAKMLGFTGGAALYPMVTMNGEECHNEWEITFEEIHRNGAIAYGIHRYIEYTGDWDYLAEYGLEVLIGIARFWAQRVNFSNQKQQYVMLGVTGPNEYENNINNNWYTSYIAMWCLKYTQKAIAYVQEKHADKLQQVLVKTKFETSESDQWTRIYSNMYLPENKELGIFLQQDNYLDKEQQVASDLPDSQRPINQYWSWDRILRSCFIKQADVLQGFYIFEDDFTEEQHRKNFDFYEPRTVHESSLSPCVHSILAAKLGRSEQAYEFYLRTARLDLDDYNAEVHEGLHITSMAGTWMSVVEGFGGMRVRDNALHFAPQLPKQWQGMKFRVRFRANVVELNVTNTGTSIHNLSGPDVTVFVNSNPHQIKSNGQVSI